MPCTIPPVIGGTAADIESALIMRGGAIASCETKRRALLNAWPR